MINYVQDALRRSRQRKRWREDEARFREQGMPKTAAFYHNLLQDQKR